MCWETRLVSVTHVMLGVMHHAIFVTVYVNFVTAYEGISNMQLWHVNFTCQHQKLRNCDRL